MGLHVVAISAFLGAQNQEVEHGSKNICWAGPMNSWTANYFTMDQSWQTRVVICKEQINDTNTQESLWLLRERKGTFFSWNRKDCRCFFVVRKKVKNPIKASPQKRNKLYRLKQILFFFSSENKASAAFLRPLGQTTEGQGRGQQRSSHSSSPGLLCFSFSWTRVMRSPPAKFV